MLRSEKNIYVMQEENENNATSPKSDEVNEKQKSNDTH